MKYAVKILIDERKRIISELRKVDADRKTLLDNLKSLDKALKWIEFLDKNNAENSESYKLIRLPFMKNCFETYRIMSDSESEDISYWKYCNIEIFPDDIILTKNKGAE